MLKFKGPFYEMTAKKEDEAEIFIYGVIGESLWSDGVGAKQFAEDLKALGDVKRISLRINSPGGSIFEGLAIYNQLQRHKAEVTASVDGIAASIASVIAMAASKLLMPANAMLMVHDPSGLVAGSSEDMRKMADALDKAKTGIISAYKAKTGMDDKDISDLMTDETWMTADDAVGWGFADEVLESVKMAASFDLSMFKKAPLELVNQIKNEGTKNHKEVQVMKCTHCGTALVEGLCPDKCEETRLKASVADTAKKTAEEMAARTAEILAVGQKFDCMDIATEAIKAGKTVEEFKGEVLEKKFKAKTAEPIDIGMSVMEEQAYSLRKAINMAAFGGEGLEMDIHNEISKKIGKQSKGIFVPLSLGMKNALDTKTEAAGGAAVPTHLLPLIELLRNRMMVKRLGARVMSGLTGNVAFPRQTGAGTLYWTGENPGSDVAAADATWDLVTLTPKTAQATTAYTRQMLQQSSPDIEAFVRDDLMLINALGLDLAAINGSGASNQPTGILQTTGIGDVAIGANGGAPTWDTVVDIETAVAVDNADVGNLAYLTNATMRGKLKKTPKVANQPIYIWEDGAEAGIGSMNGYRAAASNQVPATLTKGESTDCSAIIYGNWADLLIGEFGIIEIIADPFTMKKQGLIEVTSFIMVDIGVRHAESFAACKDARNV